MSWKSFVGSFIYFVMNALLIYAFTRGTGVDAGILLVIYFVISTLLILTPAGDWLLCLLANAKPIPRKDMKIKIIPLLEIVLSRAKTEMPPMTDSVIVRFIDDAAPMAFALGRRTICVTDGLLRLTDDDIIGALSHEVAHLAFRHTTYHLFVGSGNIIITGFVLIIKTVLKLIILLSTISLFKKGSKVPGLIISVFTILIHIVVTAWVKTSQIFLCWSKRENEFIADRFAFDIGFGEQLAACLEKLNKPSNSTFINGLLSDHLTVHERIGRLQEMGVNYRHY